MKRKKMARAAKAASSSAFTRRKRRAAEFPIPMQHPQARNQEPAEGNRSVKAEGNQDRKRAIVIIPDQYRARQRVAGLSDFHRVKKSRASTLQPLPRNKCLGTSGSTCFHISTRHSAAPAAFRRAIQSNLPGRKLRERWTISGSFSAWGSTTAPPRSITPSKAGA